MFVLSKQQDYKEELSQIVQSTQLTSCLLATSRNSDNRGRKWIGQT